MNLNVSTVKSEPGDGHTRLISTISGIDSLESASKKQNQKKVQVKGFRIIY